jgi:hypothetical protein
MFTSAWLEVCRSREGPWCRYLLQCNLPSQILEAPKILLCSLAALDSFSFQAYGFGSSHFSKNGLHAVTIITLVQLNSGVLHTQLVENLTHK